MSVCSQPNPTSFATPEHIDTLVFRTTCFVLCTLAIAPFWVGEYMPMVDLPQHAAQLAIDASWHDLSSIYHKVYHVNWHTNQLFAYSFVRLFEHVVPLVPAIKLVLTLSVLELALAVYWLVRSLGGNTWWSLLALPLGYSFSLYWGFFNYVVALPFGIGLIVLSTRYALAPSWRKALVILVWTNVLFFAHALILAYAGLVSAALIAARAKRFKAKLVGGLALATVLPTVFVWWHVIQSNEASTTATEVVTDWGFFRLRAFFNMQIGNACDDNWDAFLGIVLLSLPFAIGARFSRELWRYIPFALTWTLFMVLPFSALEVAFIFERFAVFALPSLLFALEPKPAPPAGRALAVSLVAAQLVSVGLRFKDFDEEAQPLNVVLKAAEPNRRVLYLPTENTSHVTWGGPYAHFGCWYQVKRGGLIDFSFAEYFPMWYRYNPDEDPPLPADFDEYAHKFRWREHNGPRYDYFLVRGPLGPEWLTGTTVELVPIAKAAEWTLWSWRDAATVARQ
ncbi:MAG: hypothetical protein RL701_6476 [Pseudomonadota bacterium]